MSQQSDEQDALTAIRATGREPLKRNMGRYLLVAAIIGVLALMVLDGRAGHYIESVQRETSSTLGGSR